MADYTYPTTPTTGNTLTELCEAASLKACCMSNALEVLVDSLEYAEQYGFAAIIELLKREADGLNHFVASIPRAVEEESHE
jgi:hypothetical protein